MGALEDLIRDGCEIASSKDFNKAKIFIRRGEALLYGNNPTLRAALYKHRQTINGYPPYTSDEVIADIETIVAAARLEIERNAARLREIEAGSASINVTAQATANAYASVDVALDFVDSCEELSDEDKEQLAALFRRMESDARKEDEPGFADKAKTAIDIADKASGLVPKVASAIGAISSLFG